MSPEMQAHIHDEAIDLAFQFFENPTDEHIECIRLRLQINFTWGAGHAGAVTVH